MRMLFSNTHPVFKELFWLERTLWWSTCCYIWLERSLLWFTYYYIWLERTLWWFTYYYIWLERTLWWSTCYYIWLQRTLWWFTCYYINTVQCHMMIYLLLHLVRTNPMVIYLLLHKHCSMLVLSGPVVVRPIRDERTKV